MTERPDLVAALLSRWEQTLATVKAEAEDDPESRLLRASVNIRTALLEDLRAALSAPVTAPASEPERREDGVYVGGPLGLHVCPACGIQHDTPSAPASEPTPERIAEIAEWLGLSGADPSRASTHSHGKATGTATTTKPAAAGTIDADLAALAKRVADLEAHTSPFEPMLADHEDRILALEAPAPDPDPVPEPEPPPATTVRVTSLAALDMALRNDANTDITLVPGTYVGDIVIDSDFASRTKPCVIRMDGVTLDGGGGTNRGRISFRGGVHDLDFRGLTLANSVMQNTGVITFDGYDEPGCRNISLRGFKVLSSVRRANEGYTRDHGVYFSHSRGGSSGILIEDLNVDASGANSLADAIHMDHAEGGLVQASNVTVRRLTFKGNGTQGSAIQQAIILWMQPIHDWLFDGGTITNANGVAIRYEAQGTRITFNGIVSTGSRQGGWSSGQGATPAGVTFVGCSPSTLK